MRKNVTFPARQVVTKAITKTVKTCCKGFYQTPEKKCEGNVFDITRKYVFKLKIRFQINYPINELTIFLVMFYNTFPHKYYNFMDFFEFKSA